MITARDVLSICESKAKVITDIGDVSGTTDTGDSFNLPRYGVWASDGHNDVVIDTGDNLQALLKKYPGVPVVDMKGRRIK